jgi:16S rRNA (adenine1518-N6/adenine1519-N6)-dimethyltransferase
LRGPSRQAQASSWDEVDSGCTTAQRSLTVIRRTHARTCRRAALRVACLYRSLSKDVDLPRRNQPPARATGRRGSSRHSSARPALAPRPRIGQHFLADPLIASDIVAAAQLGPNDDVLEIGPGRGALTGELLNAAAHVTAVELDEGLAAALRQRFAGNPRLTVIADSILAHAPDVLLAEGGRRPPYAVVANLPYYITAPVMRHLLERGPRPSRIVVMIQREVAESITGKGAGLSLLGVSVQVFAAAELLFRVPSTAFDPPPKVESAVVRLAVYEQPLVPPDRLDGFFNVVRAGFRNPRKQLHNALASGLWMASGEAPASLEAAGVDPMRRAATLSIAEWSRLHDVYEAVRAGTPLSPGGHASPGDREPLVE